MSRSNQVGEELVTFNGVSGVDGSYPFPRTTVADLAALARGERLERRFVDRLQRWLRNLFRPGRTMRDEFSPSHLDSAGWGVIFPRGCDPKVREALRPLLEWRQGQAAALDEGRYREFWGDDGYAKEELVRDFLLRHNAEFSAADPRQMPYYLLLVGGPDEIPFTFQYDLDLRYAVGRLDLDTPQEYAAYAESVVTIEKSRIGSSSSAGRRLALFCPNNSDNASLRVRDELIGGLLGRLSAAPRSGWDLRSVLDEDATREGLCDMLGGEGKPDVLFTACHGLAFPSGHKLQRDKQGALVCRTRRDTPYLETSVSAADISDQARVHGLITFHFACYGAGTDGLELEEFTHGKALRHAERPFTARLPQRLLGHPNGGALAVIGHVSRAWTYSFSGFGNSPHISTYEDILHRILRGERVGYAMELLNLSYAEKAAELMTLRELENLASSNGQREGQLALAYCVAKDARNYVVLGDPAVRLEPPGVPEVTPYHPTEPGN